MAQRRTARKPTGRRSQPSQANELVDLGEAKIEEEAPKDLGKSKHFTPEEVVSETPVGISERRELTRGLLAAWLSGLLGAIVIAAPVLLATKRVSIGELEKLAQLILTPVVAIVGSVVGFYFGGVTAEAEPRPRRRRGRRIDGS